MKELIEDGCDINIAVNKIPLVLYALEKGKQEALNLILEKGVDWDQFISNCKKDGTIKKIEGIHYNVKDLEKINWLKFIVDKELIGMNLSDKVDKGHYFCGLLEALLKDGYDSSARVILKKNKDSCSIIKYAAINNKNKELNY